MSVVTRIDTRRLSLLHHATLFTTLGAQSTDWGASPSELRVVERFTSGLLYLLRGQATPKSLCQ